MTPWLCRRRCRQSVGKLVVTQAQLARKFGERLGGSNIEVTVAYRPGEHAEETVDLLEGGRNRRMETLPQAENPLDIGHVCPNEILQSAKVEVGSVGHGCLLWARLLILRSWAHHVAGNRVSWFDRSA